VHSTLLLSVHRLSLRLQTPPQLVTCAVPSLLFKHEASGIGKFKWVRCWWIRRGGINSILLYSLALLVLANLVNAGYHLWGSKDTESTPWTLNPILRLTCLDAAIMTVHPRVDLVCVLWNFACVSWRRLPENVLHPSDLISKV